MADYSLLSILVLSPLIIIDFVMIFFPRNFFAVAFPGIPNIPESNPKPSFVRTLPRNHPKPLDNPPNLDEEPSIRSASVNAHLEDTHSVHVHFEEDLNDEIV